MPESGQPPGGLSAALDSISGLDAAARSAIIADASALRTLSDDSKALHEALRSGLAGLCRGSSGSDGHRRCAQVSVVLKAIPPHATHGLEPPLECAAASAGSSEQVRGPVRDAGGHEHPRTRAADPSLAVGNMHVDIWNQ